MSRGGLTGVTWSPENGGTIYVSYDAAKSIYKFDANGANPALVVNLTGHPDFPNSLTDWVLGGLAYDTKLGVL